MPVNITAIQSQSSNAPIQLPPVIVTAPRPSGSSNNPQDSIKPVNAASGNLLVYPSDRPKYYLQFDIYNYKRQNLLEIGSLGQPIQTIALPLSDSLIDVTSANWKQDEIGLGGWFFNKGLEALNGIPTINSLNNLGEAGARIIGASSAAAAGTIINSAAQLAAQFAGGAFDAAQAFFGIAPNQFFTVLYVSPMYKRFGFQWKVSPNSKEEADTLRKIGNAFKNAMSPSLTLDGAAFKFPSIFKIGLHPNSRMLYKFKPAVLEACEIDYTPTGRSAFYMDANAAAGENAPEGMNIRLRFIELELWMKGNHNDANLPDNVYTTE
jgi:hypothetical protein